MKTAIIVLILFMLTGCSTICEEYYFWKYYEQSQENYKGVKMKAKIIKKKCSTTKVIKKTCKIKTPPAQFSLLE